MPSKPSDPFEPFPSHGNHNPDDLGNLHAVTSSGGGGEDNSKALVVRSAGGTSGGKGRTGTAGETEVENIPRSRFSPWDQVVQVRMPYYRYGITGTVNAGAAAIADKYDVYSFRLNSIYDCEKTFTPNQDPSAVADSADATVNTPMMRSYWMNFYRYWSVVRSSYKVSIRTTANTGSTSGEITMYLYEHGLQTPPVTKWTDTDVLVTHQYRKQHPGCQWVHVKSQPKLTTSGVQGTELDWKTVHGFFFPGKIDHEVVEDELAQVWQTASEVPPTPEVLTLIIQPSARNKETSAISYVLDVIIEYEVQLKDLKAQYQYIAQDTSVSALSNCTIQNN